MKKTEDANTHYVKLDMHFNEKLDNKFYKELVFRFPNHEEAKETYELLLNLIESGNAKYIYAPIEGGTSIHKEPAFELSLMSEYQF